MLECWLGNPAEGDLVDDGLFRISCAAAQGIYIDGAFVYKIDATFGFEFGPSLEKFLDRWFEGGQRGTDDPKIDLDRIPHPDLDSFPGQVRRFLDDNCRRGQEDCSPFG